MKKLSVDINNPPDHLKKLVQYAIEEARSSGGDGDCTIICRSYEMKDIADLIWKELEIIDNQKWYEYHADENDSMISIVSGEETIMITDDVNCVRPDWLQCVIRI